MSRALNASTLRHNCESLIFVWLGNMGNMNMCTMFHGNLSSWCWDISPENCDLFCSAGGKVRGSPMSSGFNLMAPLISVPNLMAIHQMVVVSVWLEVVDWQTNGPIHRLHCHSSEPCMARKQGFHTKSPVLTLHRARVTSFCNCMIHCRHGGVHWFFLADFAAKVQGNWTLTPSLLTSTTHARRDSGTDRRWDTENTREENDGKANFVN